MTSYFLNNKGQDIPSGSIIAYFINTAIDPSGWVIMNGINRTDGENGKYNNLINLGIGSGILNGNYTPPNYNGAFLRGSGSSGSYSGPSINLHQTHATQIHNHTASQVSHTHTHNANGANNNGSSANPKYGLFYYSNITGPGGADSSTSELCLNINAYDDNSSYTYSNLVINSAQPAITVQNNVGENETRPYNIGVNWILKL